MDEATLHHEQNLEWYGYQIEAIKIDMDIYVMLIVEENLGGYEIESHNLYLNKTKWETIHHNDDQAVQSETTNDNKSI